MTVRGQQAFLALEAKPDAFLNSNKVGIDWERVASKVAYLYSSIAQTLILLQVSAAGSSNGQRTAHECEIRWLGDRHPEFDHSQWTQPEIIRVKELVGNAAEGQVDWVDVAQKLGVGGLDQTSNT